MESSQAGCVRATADGLKFSRKFPRAGELYFFRPHGSAPLFSHLVIDWEKSKGRRSCCRRQWQDEVKAPAVNLTLLDGDPISAYWQLLTTRKAFSLRVQ